MASVFDNLQIVKLRVSGFEATDANAWTQGACQRCGEGQMAVVAHTTSHPLVKWLRCVSCNRGAVDNFGTISPQAPPLNVPLGVSGDVLQVWEEARQCLGIGAYCAAVMMCRKLLLHVAVSHGLAAKKENGRAPNFYEALEHLQHEGIISAPMRKWADRIKEVGNQQNHEIGAIGTEDAMDVAKFTEKLLELAFEMDFLFNQGTSRKVDAVGSTPVPTQAPKSG